MLDNAGLKQDVFLYIFNLFVGYSVDLVESISKHFKCIFYLIPGYPVGPLPSTAGASLTPSSLYPGRPPKYFVLK